MTDHISPTQSGILNKKLVRNLTVAGALVLAIMALSLALHLYKIDTLNDANAYYTAAVKSMLMSWKNFFFAAAEPGGSVTVDKPPLGLWIETVFAFFLGVSGFSVSLPNILAGVLSVPLLYAMVKRYMGALAGLIAALVMTITPVFVATNRNNTQDGLLVFFLLLSAWAFIQAVETGKTRWLMLGALLVGLGFNIKMLQAYLPLPAFYALYFFGSRQGWLRKMLNLAAATLLLAAVSLSWAVVVDLVPADQRPYIGSSENNTVMSLIFGHNGISRLESTGGGAGNNRPNPAPGGQQPGAQPAPQTGQNGRQPPAQALAACANSDPGANCSFTLPGGQNIRGTCINAPNTSDLVCAPPGGAAGGGTSGGGSLGGGTPGLNQPGAPQNGTGPAPNQGQNPGGTPFSQETGSPGVLRFFTSPLSRQMSWLLPFALLSVLLALFAARVELPVTAGAHKALVLWGGWLLTCVVFFSIISGIFHAYYAIMLAPALGAVVGLGAELVLREPPKSFKRVFFLLAGAGLTISFQYFAAGQYGEKSAWLWASAVLLAIGYGLYLFRPRLASLMIVTAMLVIPLYWTVQTAASSPDVNLPGAYVGMGQAGSQPGTGSQPAPGRLLSNSALVEFLQDNTKDVVYLAAVPSANQQGAQLVLATGRPVLYMGGFSGGDNVVDASDLEQMVTTGELRYVFYNDQGGKPEITTWLQHSCRIVPEFNAQPGVLYECR